MLGGSPNGAGDETRTRDILLGKQVLYRLSYSRVATSIPLVALPVNLGHEAIANAPLRQQ